jgi:hypothetical protein
MNSPELDFLVESVKPVFKVHGFKKSNLTWHKETSETILVFNIQKSQWGPEFYINVGIYLKALGSENKPPEYRCHVQSRINYDGKSTDVLLKDVFEWFDNYGSVSNLRELAKRDELPLATVLQAREFLNCRG